jgi:hypothetical protein
MDTTHRIEREDEGALVREDHGRVSWAWFVVCVVVLYLMWTL